MAKFFYTDIDGDLNQLQNWALHNLASDPVTPTDGQIWLNTTTGELKYYDGTSIQTIASLATISGGLTFKGGYNATTDAPILDGDGGTKITVTEGDVYVVDTAGTFYTEEVEVGDVLIARNGTNATIADWITVQNNIGAASETQAGYIEIATQAETDTGTDDTRAITPLKLATYLSNQEYVTSYTQTGISVGTTPGAQVITHNLNKRPVHVSVMDTSNNEMVELDVTYTSVNSVTIEAKGVTRTVDVYIS